MTFLAGVACGLAIGSATGLFVAALFAAQRADFTPVSTNPN